MINIDNTLIWKQHENYIKGYDSEASASLPFITFISSTFPKLYEQYAPQYPITVNVPKSVNDLLRGDFEPARTFVIDKPIMKPFPALEMGEDNEVREVMRDIPIWFNSSQENVYLRFGYENGDSRFMSNYAVGNNNVSAIMGGATGQGKSVSLNNVIFNAALEYPPWELDLVMSDAKIIEFKKYAQFTPLPHISAIAATSDTDYLISIYENFLNEMTIWNSGIFPQVGASSLIEFRKRTGLTVPRHLLIADEFQTMFKNAGRKKERLISVIDSLARLGRSAGFHLFFASQELGDDLPKGTLANIKLRSCLGAQPAVSQKILNNDQAKLYYGKRGNLVVNDDPTKENEESKLNNRVFRVPFISDSNQMEVGKQIVEWGNEYNFKRSLTFYDEMLVVRENKYTDYLNTFTRNKDTLCLGEPAFVIPDPEKMLKLKFANTSTENVMLVCGNNTEKYRFFRMLEKNFEPFRNQVKHLVLGLDNVYIRECNARDLASHPLFYSDNRLYQGNQWVALTKLLIYRRRMALEADKLTEEEPITSDDGDKMLKDLIENEGLNLTYSKLNKCRCFYLNKFLREPGGIYNTSFGVDDRKGEEREKYVKEQVLLALFQYADCGCDTESLTAEKFQPCYCWVLGLDQFVGIGRDSKSSFTNDFKKILMDSSEVAVRFLLFTSGLDDLGDLRVGIRWYLGRFESRQCNIIKCETYPTEVSSVLSVMFDSLGEGKECYKFKKMFLNDELVV